MDRNIVNKVFINPNFKNNSVRYLQTTYEHSNISNNYLQDETGKPTYRTNANRKIYVNPNFKLAQPQRLSISTLQVQEKSCNIQVNPAFISKSKYSLVANKFPKKEAERITNYVQTITSRDTEGISHTPSFLNNQHSTQSVIIDNKLKVIPTVKSRYSIVRKKTFCENKIEILSKIPDKSIKRSIENVSVNTGFANSYQKDLVLKSVGKDVVLNYKPVEKTITIKLSKYKTVPIAYLKSQPATSQNKEYYQNKETLTKNNKSDTYKFSSLNKNKFKFTKPVSEGVNTPTKMCVQTNKKNVWLNNSKVKIKKAGFKLNNIPCRLFTKYGKCLRKDYGKCEYLHDKKHVSLCRKFLKGICHDRDCPLSHELTANKMPTCYFYLKGICTKENCPYLHIKLSDKIKICQDFLKGYCESGDKCNFRHIKTNESKKVRSNLMNANKCLQSKNIIVKRGNIKTKIDKKKSLTLLRNRNKVTQQKEDNQVHCRYYKDSGTNEDICENIKPTRCKIGTLPSFIQL